MNLPAVFNREAGIQYLYALLPDARVDEAKMRRLAQNAYSDYTYKGYFSSLMHFMKWTGLVNPFPTTPELIACYLTYYSDKLAPTTLNHRVAALSFLHRKHKWPDPTVDEHVTDLLRGIRRTRVDKGWTQDQAKPFTIQEVKFILSRMGNTLQDIRDKAFILTGMIGAFRTGELCRLDVGMLLRYPQGYVINMGRTKQDQLNLQKKYKVLPEVKDVFCPVAALDAWLQAANIKEGAVFRGIDHQSKDRVTAISHTTANRIIHRWVKFLGADPKEYSGNSLRSSFVTIARELGIPDVIIVRQTLHQDIKTLNIYDRPDLCFQGSPASLILNSFNI